MRWTLAAAGSAIGFSLVLGNTAYAQPKAAPKLVDLGHEKTIKPITGFIDDPMTFDGAGGRLLYVNADSGYLAELNVIDLSQGMAQIAKIDISKFSTTPIAVHFVDEGYFVVSRPSETDKATAAVIDGRGKVLRKFGPATDIALTSRDGEPVVALYTRIEKRVKVRGKKAMRHHHTVQVVRLKNKRAVGKKRVLIADDRGLIKKLDFRINHWTNGYTRLVGIKGGSWDAKENQRSPDHEAWYDVVTGVFEKSVDITNVMAHAVQMRSYARRQNQEEFLDVAENLSSVELVTPTGRQPIELAQPFGHYDPKTLEHQPTTDGLFLFSLKIDPVNKDAVARKRADPEYLDLYLYRSGENKAMRLARFLMNDKKKRQISWRATEEYWVLVPRLLGFSRGGKELQIYKINAKP